MKNTMIEDTESSLAIISERADFLKKFKEFLKNDFVDGVDYGVIPRTDKPTLLKAGFEKIQYYLNLQANYTLEFREFTPNKEIKSKRWNTETKSWETIEAIRNFYYWEWKCELCDPNTGDVIVTGYGSANTEEKKFRSQYEKGDLPDSFANNVLKIAKKRALGDAILSVACVSDMFTVDLEDSDSVKEMKTDKTTKVGKPTKDNMKTIYATLAARNLIAKDFDEILKEMGYEKVQDLKSSDVNKVLAKINELAKKREEEGK